MSETFNNILAAVPVVPYFPDIEEASNDGTDELRAVRELSEQVEQNEHFRPLLDFILATEEGSDTPDAEVNEVLRRVQACIEEGDKDGGTWGGQGGVKTEEVPFDKIPNAKQLKVFVVQRDGSEVIPFNNWGMNVSYQPSETLVVGTIEGLCKVVKWAGSPGQRKRVRVSGFRHTWTGLYGEDGSINVMLQPFRTLTELPYQQPKDWSSEFYGIDLVTHVAGRKAPDGHAFCKVMAGTSNGDFRKWCYDNALWCLPFNVIMLEVTFGGTNAPICHGAGLSSSTLSDIVVEVSYVDANGVVQTVNDPALLRAASGGFGLLGVVISVTLQLDAITVTDMHPVKLLLPLAIPPPAGYSLPKQVQKMIRDNHISQDQLEQARKDFVKRCEEDYYVEWFWFPYQTHVWVNTWKKRDKTPEERVKEFPGNGFANGAKSQARQATIANKIADYPKFRKLPGWVQAYLFGRFSMFALPPLTNDSKAITTYISEAMHFRRGIQNFRCWDMEWEIPIPGKENKRDYETVQRAWWDGISAMYAHHDDGAPVRVALEMRLTGSSDIILAPQRGNSFGTASIEVLTTLATPEEKWLSFCQEITDKWTNYVDAAGGLLNARPHWAKHWKGLTVRGKPIEKYLKEDAYKDALPEFRDVFKTVVESNGGTVAEARARFGNPLLERLIYG